MDNSLDQLRQIIVGAFPELATARFSLLAEGWDSLAVDADDRLIFKFPRDDEASGGLEMEARLLTLIRPAISMPVPELTLIRQPRLFSRHVKLPGEHLLSAQYALLGDVDRQGLAEAMAQFYTQLHAIDQQAMREAGAQPVGHWLGPDDILRGALPLLPDQLHALVKSSVAEFVALPPDPFGVIYGFFDGHGWNMAFDHAAHRLNGIYDFADSGFGALHQEFIYSNFISSDLTERIVAAYEASTGRQLDRRRIWLLTGMLRLSELADQSDDVTHLPQMLQSVRDWASSQ